MREKRDNFNFLWEHQSCPNICSHDCIYLSSFARRALSLLDNLVLAWTESSIILHLWCIWIVKHNWIISDNTLSNTETLSNVKTELKKNSPELPFLIAGSCIVCCINFGSCTRKGISEHLFYPNNLASRVRSHACEFTRDLRWSNGSALDSRVKGQGINTVLGQVSQKFHLISPGCPRPNSAFIVQKSGLKHRHLWVYHMTLHVEEFPLRQICHL